MARLKQATEILVKGMRDAHAEAIAKLQEDITAVTIQNENLQNELSALPCDPADQRKGPASPPEATMTEDELWFKKL